MTGEGCLNGPRPILGSSSLFTAVIIVFFVFNCSSMIEVVGYSPVLRYSTDNKVPTIRDPSLEVEEVAHGLELPTSMAFLGKDDILVLEKNKGTVQRIVNAQTVHEPAIDVNVATEVERCMCGIAVSSDDNNTQRIFLYYTEADFRTEVRPLVIGYTNLRY